MTLVVACAVFGTGLAYAQLTSVSGEAASTVVGHWVELGNELNWGFSLNHSQLPELQEIWYNNELLGYAAMADQSYVIVAAFTELPPITAYSTTSTLNLADEGGFVLMLKEALAYKVNVAREVLGTPNPLPEMQPVLEQIERDRRLWADYSGTYNDFTRALAEENQQSALDEAPELPPGRYGVTTVEPLLTTSWHQSSPYYNFDPMGDGGRCVVGCVATACAQIMAYWQHPNMGSGSHTYTWNGDQSCGGNVGGGSLSATYSDLFDWANMPDRFLGSETQAQRDAVAELCYEVAVAVNMDFGRCGSGAYTGAVQTILPQYFGYATDIDRENRNAYTQASGWFAMLQEDLDQGWPMQYRIASHSIVCDGWRVSGDNQLHMNYGWADGHTAWYTVDNLYCNWSGCDPLVEYVIRRIHPTGTGAVAQLDVTAPNGGEAWTTGLNADITWTSANFSENVRIELNRSYPSGTWEVLSPATTNDGIYTWSVGGAATIDARIRVIGATTTTVGDTSDANFAIIAIPAPTITVLTPNGGESWTVGAPGTVLWTSANFTENVRIELNRSYPSTAWEVLTASTINDGSFSWAVSGLASSSARIRVAGATTPSVSDTSNANFSILAAALPSLTVTAPNGGETWTLGAPAEITWSSSDLTENVRIELKRNYPNGSWETITTSTANDGAYTWTPAGSTSNRARIRISGSINSTVRDTSNAGFNLVTLRSITITHPSGGEELIANETHEVTWTSQNVAGAVRIELNSSYPAGAWEALSDSVANSGSFLWVVGAEPTDNARLRILSLDDLAVGDTTNSDFGITPPPESPQVVIEVAGDALRLAWEPTGAASYHVYSAATTSGPFDVLEGATSDTTFIAPISADVKKFYIVQSSTLP